MNIKVIAPLEEEIIVRPTDFYDILKKEIYIEIILRDKKAVGKAYEVISRGLGCIVANSNT